MREQGKYKHLNLEERERMYALKESGLSFRKIAKELNRSHTTLSREWRRNAPYLQEYIPCRAQRKAKKRAFKQRVKAPLKETYIFLYVREKLELKWSPETIAGRLSLDYPDYSIHHETIYRYIYRRENRQDRLWEYLTLGRKRRMKKAGRRPWRESRIPDAVSIDQRPKVVERRKVAGHWESDNVEGKREDKSVISVTQERVSRYVLLVKMTEGTARVKTDAVVEGLRNLPEGLLGSLTVDNGSENAYHKEITQHLGLPVYFCHPYHSWEKPSVENINGWIRRYLPKKTTRLDEVSTEKIEAIQFSLNNTPRKCLGFLTPCERMIELGYPL